MHLGRALMALQATADTDEFKAFDIWNRYLRFACISWATHESDADSPKLGGFEKKLLAELQSLLEDSKAVPMLHAQLVNSEQCPSLLKGTSYVSSMVHVEEISCMKLILTAFLFSHNML